MLSITWLGHSAVHVVLGGRSVLFDPFLTGNPSYPENALDRLGKIDLICVTHGHEDHLGDAAPLAKQFGVPVACNYEISVFLSSQGVENVEPINAGGSIDLLDLHIAFTRANHSSSVHEDGRARYLGSPCGIVVRSQDDGFYHAGDTDLFSDMSLIRRLYRPRVGALPIGDRLTMGPRAAAIAQNEFLQMEAVLPIHWGTFPLLTGTPDVFQSEVNRGQVLRPKPGETIEI
ncbi:MAG TPA: metal-dependent hydrolase [Geminicoccus sp.]|jgi:L-ascorbate metabolism protein UlaG (beta-lactamase superfamily)|uniref:metal-dependent hydrolase n=1 Tax=Geminicoccus sp. TaxID=2024832 RepID=UPI002E380E5A|nr:metal-dependent hydrolase [Geminicoccus sp.]HEX2528637.1 metal-dependent hydrolase [Geminicoccus sp.]